MKVVIIGGVAAGLSAASEIKRQAPDAQVIVLEKGGDVSYAACGMPYNLLFQDVPVESMYALSYDTILNKRKIDYRLHHEVRAIDPGRQSVSAIDHRAGREYEEGYDCLLYATGNRPNHLDVPGLSDDDVFSFKTLDDTRRVKAFLYEHSPKTALLIGAGYVNLEMTDVLCSMKIRTVIVDKAPVILPAFCEAVREKVMEKLYEEGVQFFSGVNVDRKEGKVIKTSAGDFTADFVIAAVGVRPNTELFAAAGGELGVASAAKVDRYLRTNLPGVFAAGDCAEHYVRQLGCNSYMPLGPAANKQGKIAGINIVSPGNMREFYGIDQTAVFKFFDLTVGTTGLNERQLRENKYAYATCVMDGHTRGKFPGDGSIRIVLFVERGSGLLLGAQMIGQDVVAKRLDVLATALYKKMTVHEIAELDLSYAPPYSPVWDPLLVAANQAIKQI
ncbi:MAG TPA: FAD-dependent oxidoreductase [Acidobacteriota bacterium]|nr:FAD-dependent oxidoreductase [Acidobacteriota bacterium]